MQAVLLIALAVGAAGLDLSQGSRLSQDLANLDSDKEWEKPIVRVVNLLKDMAAELDKEAKTDQDLYDKLACWCETNDKDKTKAIADGNDMIASLTASIESNTALASTRETEIATLTAEAADLQKALETAKANREKENDEFNLTEKDLIQSIGSLKNAVRQLGKSQGEQPAEELLLQVTQVLKRHRAVTMAAVAPHLRSTVRQLLSTPRNAISLLQQPQTGGDKSGYESQSGAIFGILKQMKEEFETNLEEGKKNEAEGAAEYASLQETKTAELNAAKEKIFTKGQELAKAKENAANDKEDLDDTTATLAADTEFLAKLKEQCAAIDAMWEERSKMRSDEIAAVGETINILTDDDARDQMNAAGTFVQLRAESRKQSRQRELTASHLASAGNRLHSRRLAYLATRVRNDVFAKVQSSIDGMVGQLGSEQKNEVKKKDGCIKDENTNEKQTVSKTDHKEDVEVEINQLAEDMTEKNEEEARLKVEIAESRLEQKKASENRETENKEFQTVVSDQQATQKILLKALDRLKQFYAKKAALLQQRAAQMPPVAFKPYKKAGSGGGAMALLENIIDESKETEKDALEAENAAQLAYEEFIKTSNDQIFAMFVQIGNAEEVEAEDGKKKVEDEGDKRATTGDILKLGEVSGTLHEACDFTVNNFGTRQEARSGEMEALKQAKNIFSGAHF